MLHTVRGSFTITTVRLTWAGVGEDNSSQTRGHSGGSTGAWGSEELQGLDGRRPVLGGPPCPGHLLARSGAPGRRPHRGRPPRLERLPVRQLGAAAGPRQRSLTLRGPAGHRDTRRSSGRQERHPHHPSAVPIDPPRLFGGRTDPAPPGSLTWEGDVSASVRPAGGSPPDGAGRPPALMVDPATRESSASHHPRDGGDVQGDAHPSRSASMGTLGGAPGRTGTASACGPERRQQ